MGDTDPEDPAYCEPCGGPCRDESAELDGEVLDVSGQAPLCGAAGAGYSAGYIAVGLVAFAALAFVAYLVSIG